MLTILMMALMCMLAIAIWSRMSRKRGMIKRNAKCRGCFYVTTSNTFPCMECKRIRREKPFDHYVPRPQ
jgi:hypothetical protein